MPPLSAVVYRADGRIPRRAARRRSRSPRRRRPPRARPLEVRAERRRRLLLRGHVPTPAPATAAGGRSAPTTTRPTACSTTSPACAPARRVRYRRSCSTTRGHTRRAARARPTVPAPAITIEAPAEGAKRARQGRGARGRRPRARHPRRDVRAQRGRRRLDADRQRRLVAGLHRVRRHLRARPRAGHADPYRAILAQPDGTRDERGAHRRARRRRRSTTAIVHYLRPAGDYGDWGLHLWGDAVDPAVLPDRLGRPRWQRRRVDDGWARVRDPAQGRHQAGQLHRAPARPATTCRTTASPAATARSCRSTTRRSGSSRATRPSTPGRRDAGGQSSAAGRDARGEQLGPVDERRRRERDAAGRERRRQQREPLAGRDEREQPADVEAVVARGGAEAVGAREHGHCGERRRRSPARRSSARRRGPRAAGRRRRASGWPGGSATASGASRAPATGSPVSGSGSGSPGAATPSTTPGVQLAGRPRRSRPRRAPRPARSRRARGACAARPPRPRAAPGAASGVAPTTRRPRGPPATRIDVRAGGVEPQQDRAGVLEQPRARPRSARPGGAAAASCRGPPRAPRRAGRRPTACSRARAPRAENEAQPHDRRRTYGGDAGPSRISIADRTASERSLDVNGGRGDDAAHADRHPRPRRRPLARACAPTRASRA